MSFSLPTLFEVAGPLTGVAGSLALMSTVGITGVLLGSSANRVSPLVVQANAFVMIGVKPRSDGVAALAMPFEAMVMMGSAAAPMMPMRVKADATICRSLCSSGSSRSAFGGGHQSGRPK